jgi:hypothetical protein
MEHARLMKLMYLADREAIDLYGLPISEDEYWAPKTGPALAITLNLVGGYKDYDSQMEWGEWVLAKENFQVGIRNGGTTERDLDWLAEVAPRPRHPKQASVAAGAFKEDASQKGSPGPTRRGGR